MNKMKEQCRICLEYSFLSELIFPCKCNGSIKFVHELCLNKWRYKSINISSYYNCDQCKYSYKFGYKYEYVSLYVSSLMILPLYFPFYNGNIIINFIFLVFLYILNNKNMKEDNEKKILLNYIIK